METGEGKVDCWEGVAVDQVSGLDERNGKRRELEGASERKCFLL